MDPLINAEVGVVGEFNGKYDRTEITSKRVSRYQGEREDGWMQLGCRPSRSERSCHGIPVVFEAVWWFPNGIPSTQNGETTIGHGDKGNVNLRPRRCCVDCGL